MNIGTHQNAHTTDAKADATGGPSVYSSTPAKPFTTKVAMQLLPSTLKKQKEMNSAVKDGQGSTFEPQSTLNGHQQRNKSECDIVAVRKDTSLQEKENEYRWVLFSGNPKTIAIGTHLFMRICINSGLNIVKEESRIAAWKLAQKYLQDARDVPKKIRIRCSKVSFIQEPSLRQESVMKKENL